MEAGFKVSVIDLLQDGWIYVDSYASYEIWIKGEIRLLYNPRKHIVYYVYK